VCVCVCVRVLYNIFFRACKMPGQWPHASMWPRHIFDSLSRWNDPLDACMLGCGQTWSVPVPVVWHLVWTLPHYLTSWHRLQMSERVVFLNEEWSTACA